MESETDSAVEVLEREPGGNIKTKGKVRPARIISEEDDGKIRIIVRIQVFQRVIRKEIFRKIDIQRVKPGCAGGFRRKVAAGGNGEMYESGRKIIRHTQ